MRFDTVQPDRSPRLQVDKSHRKHHSMQRCHLTPVEWPTIELGDQDGG